MKEDNHVDLLRFERYSMQMYIVSPTSVLGSTQLSGGDFVSGLTYCIGKPGAVSYKCKKIWTTPTIPTKIKIELYLGIALSMSVTGNKLGRGRLKYISSLCAY